MYSWEFPGGPVGRRSHCVGSDPGLGTKLPQAAQHGKKTKESVDSRLSEGLVDCFLAKRRELGAGRN